MTLTKYVLQFPGGSIEHDFYECDQADVEIAALRQQRDEALGALGYSVPGDTPCGRYVCGLCGPKDEQLDQSLRTQEQLVANVHMGLLEIGTLRAELAQVKFELVGALEMQKREHAHCDGIQRQLAQVTAERDSEKAVRLSYQKKSRRYDEVLVLNEQLQRQLAEAQTTIKTLQDQWHHAATHDGTMDEIKEIADLKATVERLEADLSNEFDRTREQASMIVDQNILQARLREVERAAKRLADDCIGTSDARESLLEKLAKGREGT